jgi:hypothetical protein
MQLTLGSELPPLVPTTNTFMTNLQANPLTPAFTGTTVPSCATVVPVGMGYVEMESARDMIVFLAERRMA